MTGINDPLNAEEVVAFLKAKKERWEGFQAWWDQDWSWEAMGSREYIDQWTFRYKGTHQVAWIDQVSKLIEFAGRRWTRFHLPPCDRHGNICSDYAVAKGNEFWHELKNRLPNVVIPVASATKDDGKGVTPAILSGVVCPGWSMMRGEDFVLVGSFDSALFLGICDFKEWRLRANFHAAQFLGGQAWFYGTKFSGGDVSFNRARFSGGDIVFDYAQFSGGRALFIAAEFSGGSATFNLTNFSGGDAWFEKSLFSGGSTSFVGARFSGGEAVFTEAKFIRSDVLFYKTQFTGGNASFSRVDFSGGPVSFYKSIFSGGMAWFDNASFSGGNASFVQTHFSGSADFHALKGQPFKGLASFSNTKFSSDVNFGGRAFLGRTEFRGGRFGGVARFHDCDLHQETYFDGSIFCDDLGQTSWVQARDQWLTKRKGRLLSVAEIEKPESERPPRSEGPLTDWLMSERGAAFLSWYRPFVLRYVPFGMRWTWMDGIREVNDHAAKEAELAFRTLRKLSEANTNIEDELRFYGLELDARRARTDVHLFERFVATLFKWTALYGTSPGRPLWVFALIFLAVSFVGAGIVHTFQFGEVARPEFWNAFQYFGRNFIPPPLVWGTMPDDFKWATALNTQFNGALTVIGSIQALTFVSFAALFLLALRRRFQIRDN
jgi:hypothetical protein